MVSAAKPPGAGKQADGFIGFFLHSMKPKAVDIDAHCRARIPRTPRQYR